MGRTKIDFHRGESKMSHLRALLLATWLLWGAVLPIVGGMFLATTLNFDPGTGALAGGLVALPLCIRGLHFADRETPPPKESTPVGDTHKIGMVLFGLAAIALGFAGLLRGATWIALPGNASGPAFAWTVTGPGGTAAALGLILLGAGALRHRGESPDDRRGCGSLLGGLLLFAAGHAIYGLERLVARLSG